MPEPCTTVYLVLEERRGEISVHKTGQAAAQAADVGDGDDRVRGDFAFHLKVIFVDHGELGVRSKLDSVQRRRGIPRGDDVWIKRGAGLTRQEKDGALASGDGGATDGAEDGGIDDAAIENAVTAANNGLAVPCEVIGKAKARTEVAVVGSK